MAPHCEPGAPREFSDYFQVFLVWAIVDSKLWPLPRQRCKTLFYTVLKFTQSEKNRRISEGGVFRTFQVIHSGCRTVAAQTAVLPLELAPTGEGRHEAESSKMHCFPK
jgi:hypothetical protein